jgi:Domain of unknown function (DUF4919)
MQVGRRLTAVRSAREIVAVGIVVLGVVGAGCAESAAGPPKARAASAASNRAPSATAVGGAPSPLSQEANADVSYYRERAAALASGNGTEIARTDFVRLRRAQLYMHGSLDSTNALAANKRLTTAFANGDAVAALEATGKILEDDQADIRAHMLRAVVLRQAGKAVEASYQREIAIALIESIVEGGDGRGFDSAWTVFREKEEYEVLKSEGYLVESQSLVRHGDRTFDVLRAHKAEGGEKIEAYFDITELFAQERSSFGG